AGCARVPVSFIRTEQTTHRPQGCAVPLGPLVGEAHAHRTHSCTARWGWAHRQGTPGEQPWEVWRRLWGGGGSMAGQQARTGRRAGGNHDRALFEHALVGIFRSTPAARCTAGNPAIVRMLEYASAAEVLALALPQDLYVDPAQWQALHACSEATGVLEGVEVRWKRKGGQPLTVSLYARALRDARGRVVSSEGLVLDVTARAQAEAALRERVRVQERIADTLPEVLYRYDLVDHYLVYVNRQIIGVLGYPPEK